MSFRRTTPACILPCLAVLLVGCGEQPARHPPAASPAPRATVRILVMDPLCSQLACDCVAGYAQRNYAALAAFLEQRTGRGVEIEYGEDFTRRWRDSDGAIDLVIGKDTLIAFDAAEAGAALRRIARLTGQDGATTLTGLFVVRQDDPAQTVADLKGYRMRFGPACEAEKHAAALAALQAAGVPPPAEPVIRPTCSQAALEVADNAADVAVISSYALALLEGCDTIDRGSLRVVGRTEPVPFIAVFATPNVDAAAEGELAAALGAVGADAALRKVMESAGGFVAPDAAPPTRPAVEQDLGWTDWRGPDRTAVNPNVPSTLPAAANMLWRKDLTGYGLSGIAATADRVIVADKDKDGRNDVWRCLNAADGEQRWELRYEAAEELDYSNAPRATPLIHAGRVYLLGAFGHLHCVRLADGQVIWKKHLVDDLGGEMPQWGYTATPLRVDGQLIVNPGGKDASLAALSAEDGRVLWKAPGGPAAYASFILAELGGVRQIVGYDAESLGGWDPADGRRLWKLVPPLEGDFNVPTPIVFDGKLLVSTENNGTRLYAFDAGGVIRPEPVAATEALAPDTATPVLLGSLLFGVSGETLLCLDAADGLKTRWKAQDGVFSDYCSLIAGNGRVLVTTNEGELLLAAADARAYEPAGRLKPFAGRSEVWSHPALVGDQLYLRNQAQIVCISLIGR